MFEKLQITAMAQSMASQAGSRMGLIAQNIAQADTPGYKAMDLPSFAETYRQGDVAPLRQTKPGHLPAMTGDLAVQPRRAPGAESPNGNSVSLEQEMVKAAGARQDHEMALAIYRNSSDIIRASLGRR